MLEKTTGILRRTNARDKKLFCTLSNVCFRLTEQQVYGEFSGRFLCRQLIPSNLIFPPNLTFFLSQHQHFFSLLLASRQHIAYMLSALCYRPSLRLSVTRADQSKTAKVRIMKSVPYGSLSL